MRAAGWMSTANTDPRLQCQRKNVLPAVPQRMRNAVRLQRMVALVVQQCLAVGSAGRVPVSHSLHVCPNGFPDVVAHEHVVEDVHELRGQQSHVVQSVGQDEAHGALKAVVRENAGVEEAAEDGLLLCTSSLASALMAAQIGSVRDVASLRYLGVTSAGE